MKRAINQRKLILKQFFGSFVGRLKLKNMKTFLWAVNNLGNFREGGSFKAMITIGPEMTRVKTRNQSNIKMYLRNDFFKKIIIQEKNYGMRYQFTK